MPLTLRNNTSSNDELAIRPPVSPVRCTHGATVAPSSGGELTGAGCGKSKTTRHLSFREKQIVSLVLQAKENKEIALELKLSATTVKEYLNRIYRKLTVRGRTELAIWAFAAASDYADTYNRILSSTAITVSLERPGFGAATLGHTP